MIEGYRLPAEPSSIDSILDHIKEFPEMESPEIFGLHPNAEISRSRKEAYDLCSRLLDLQPRAVESSFDVQKEQLLKLSEKILQKINKKFDVEEIQKKHSINHVDSMNTVLIQELTRYNNLLESVISSLADLKKAHEGIILITSELESLGAYMLKNQIPAK